MPGHAAGKTNLVLIFDASGSMWGQINGIPKITIAKEAMDDIIKGLPDDNGLFMPEIIPQFSDEFLHKLPELTFHEIALESARLLFQDRVQLRELEMKR